MQEILFLLTHSPARFATRAREWKFVIKILNIHALIIFDELIPTPSSRDFGRVIREVRGEGLEKSVCILHVAASVALHHIEESSSPRGPTASVHRDLEMMRWRLEIRFHNGSGLCLSSSGAKTKGETGTDV
jgi:hypothetical protein